MYWLNLLLLPCLVQAARQDLNQRLGFAAHEADLPPEGRWFQAEAPSVFAEVLQSFNSSCSRGHCRGATRRILASGTQAKPTALKPTPAGQTGQRVQVTGDGIWCWFADPRAVYYKGKFERTYIGWVNQNGDIQVGGIDHKTGKALPTTTLHTALQVNDHANPALLHLSGGRLMIFYSAHNGPVMYYRTTVSPEDISSWGPVSQINPSCAPPLNCRGFTYPNPARLTGERNKLYLFFRHVNWQPSVSVSTDNGKTWSAPRLAILGPDQDRPYVKVTSDGTNTIHLAFTDGHPISYPNNRVYYAYLRGGWWYKANGKRIQPFNGAPLNRGACDVVYDASLGSGWIWDIGIRNGRPVVVFAALASETQHNYRYATWDGNAWRSNFVVMSGGPFYAFQNPSFLHQTNYSGGIVLDKKDARVVYLSRQAGGGVHQVERWATNNGGKDWPSKRVIGQASGKASVRPVGIAGHPWKTALAWVQISKYVDYLSYSASVQAFVEA